MLILAVETVIYCLSKRSSWAKSNKMEKVPPEVIINSIHVKTDKLGRICELGFVQNPNVTPLGLKPVLNMFRGRQFNDSLLNEIKKYALLHFSDDPVGLRKYHQEINAPEEYINL